MATVKEQKLSLLHPLFCLLAEIAAADFNKNVATGLWKQKRDFYPDDNNWLYVGSAFSKHKHSPPLWR